MGAYADIYRRLLVQKNLGACFIKYWARGIFVLLYCHCYNDSMVATSNGDIWKFSLIKPPFYCSNMLFIYEFHNKISSLGHFEVIDFWPYILAFKAAGPKILWNTAVTSIRQTRPQNKTEIWPWNKTDSYFFPEAQNKTDTLWPWNRTDTQNLHVCLILWLFLSDLRGQNKTDI